MAFKLLVAQNQQLVEHQADFAMDGRKMLFKDQLAYCQENFKNTTSSSAISRIWADREK